MKVSLHRTAPDRRCVADVGVEFVYGEATVEAELGKYMIDSGLAQKTRLILPAKAGEFR